MATSTQDQVKRRLAAVLVVDVAGFSRMMGADEGGTALTLRERRAEIDPIVASHGGRIVKSTGDGVLVEFPSIVAAVECGVTVQKLMAQRNAEVTEDRRMLFRIGINLGDVLIEGDDILGDGVNIAARLESIASPGGICISEAAYQQVRDKLALDFEDAGDRQLKNIARPLRIYRVRLDEVAPAKPALSLPDKPSIAILPFENMSGDSQQDYFADGIVEELITALSRFRELFVIARNSSFSYRGRAVDVKQIGRELGVRYVVEGSVRKAGQRVRVNVQLIDVESGGHLWADRFDREIDDVLELQDSIAIELAGALEVELVEVESRRRKLKINPDAFDLEMQARAIWHRGRSRENFAAANKLYDRALALDPNAVMSMTGLATGLAVSVVSLWSENPDADLARAEALARKALALDPHDAASHYALGFVHRMLRRFDEAIGELETAIRLNPNMQIAYNTIGFTKVLAGRTEEGLEHFADSIRLSPRDPMSVVGYYGIGWIRFLLGDDEQAKESLRRSIALNPGYVPARLWVTATYAMQGRSEESREALAAYLRISPTVETIAKLRANAQSSHPVYLAQRERLYEGMRRAGMAET